MQASFTGQVGASEGAKESSKANVCVPEIFRICTLFRDNYINTNVIFDWCQQVSITQASVLHDTLTADSTLICMAKAVSVYLNCVLKCMRSTCYIQTQKVKVKD